MGDKICSECGEKIQDSRKQKAELSMVIKSLRMIRVAGVKELEESTKDDCAKCKKKAFRSLLKPYAQALGKKAEEW